MPARSLRGTDAQAFGVGRAPIIALDGGFRILRRTKPAVFRALLHHELAHFANRDIGRSYFSDALWKSIRWLLVFPFLLTLAAILLAGIVSGILGRGLLALALAAVPGAFLLFLQWGLVLSRFLDGPVRELFIYLNLSWLAFMLLVSPAAFGLSWAAIHFLFTSRPPECPRCGKTTGHLTPAIELCMNCEAVLGEWLFVPESPE